MDTTLEFAVEAARNLKVAAIEAGGGPTDIVPVVTFHRNGQQVAVVMVNPEEGPPRDVALGVARAGIDGWRCDRVTLTIEGYTKVAPRGLTLEEAENIEPGALQAEFGRDAETDVTEVLIVTEFGPGGVLGHSMLPFHYGEQGALVWDETKMPESTGIEGLIPDLMTKFFTESASTLATLMRTMDAMGIEPPVDWEHHSDMAVCTLVAERGHAVMGMFGSRCTCDD